MKKIRLLLQTSHQHWVGDGFPVRTIFSYSQHGRELSPFLLLDYAGPANFTPTRERRGVGEHPHRGFETVTLVYEGEVEHRDSGGGGGRIGPGDVQWMTAASGVVHQEFHSEEFSRKGGRFEVVQLWVNLPKKDKMTKPRYQALHSQDIPVVELENGAGSIRIIAGVYREHRGPAQTFTPMNVWDLRLKPQGSTVLTVPADHTAAVLVLSGRVEIAGEQIGEAQLAVLDPAGTEFELKGYSDSQTDSRILFLGGQPIPEPIVGYGPFVMNTKEEIAQAYEDYKHGRLIP